MPSPINIPSDHSISSTFYKEESRTHRSSNCPSEKCFTKPSQCALSPYPRTPTLTSRGELLSFSALWSDCPLYLNWTTAPSFEDKKKIHSSLLLWREELTHLEKTCEQIEIKANSTSKGEPRLSNKKRERQPWLTKGKRVDLQYLFSEDNPDH